MEYVKSSIRKVYGRTKKGSRNRRLLKISMTPETVDMIEMVTEVGRGKNGSAFIELSVRTMIALISSGEDLDQIAIEINKAIESPYMTNNLERLRKMLEA